MVKIILLVFMCSMQQMAIASNGFPVDLYHQLSKEDGGNFVVSPYSIQNVLLMIVEGAQEETALEIGSVLGLSEELRTNDDNNPWKLNSIHEVVNQLNSSMKDPVHMQSEKQVKELNIERVENVTNVRGLMVHKRPVEYDSGVVTELDVNSSMWSEKKYQFNQSYIDKIEQYCGEGSFFTADMINHPRETVNRINDWVDQKTGGKISRVVNSVNDDERLILINTVYFKGEWEVPFGEQETAPHEFTLIDGSVSNVEMMVNNDRFGSTIRYAAFNRDGSYFETPMYDTGNVALYPDQDGFAVVELPYKNARFSMIVIVPNEYDGFSNLQKLLTSRSLGKWIGSLKDRETTTYLPRFKVGKEYVDLDSTLKSLGMVRAFDDKKSQLGNMIAIQSEEELLFISQMIHKTFLEVNERGTEATAASVAKKQVLSYAPPFKPVFKADKPFIFIVRDRRSKVILFVGHYTMPS